MGSKSGEFKRRRKESDWGDENATVEYPVVEVQDRPAKVEKEVVQPSAIPFGGPPPKRTRKSQKVGDDRSVLGRKIRLLESEIRQFDKDIEKLGWDKLTAREHEEYQLKKRVLEQYRREENGETEGFQIQDDYVTEDGMIDTKRKEEALYAKEWSADEKRKKNMQVGSTRFTHLKGDGDKSEAKYRYVFDRSQQIEFEDDTPAEDMELDAEQKDLEAQIKAEESRIKTLDETRKSLPVYQYRDRLLDAVKKYPVLIVVGETGSGKTTQLPQYLYESGYSNVIGCTQPRRVAATAVAARVADEVGTKVGDKVGYSIRFDDKTSDKTRIKYMTDGMLLREFMSDPELAKYSAMMVDEAHERTLHTDILLGLLKDITKKRPADFRLIISSATMDADKFSRYFDDAPIFNIPGRRFPVEMHYTVQPEANYLHAATTTVFQIHLSQKSAGDILVFLTGQDEIETMADNLVETVDKLGPDQCPPLIVCPIYANLPPERQKLIFEPTPKGSRKVVLATNIAETSLTIDGISYVIDSGFVKQDKFSASTGVQKLEAVACSRASADQRAGRAGRTGPGKCFRLYTKWSFYEEMPASPTPEILRANLAGVVLQMLTLGIRDLVHFDFLDRPSPQALAKALEELYALGALNEKGELTKIGLQMADMPTEPKFARSLIASSELGCCHDVLSVVVMLGEAGSLFFHEKGKESGVEQFRTKGNAKMGGDHLTLLEVWNEFVESGYSPQWCRDHGLQYRSLLRARSARTQLERLCKRLGMAVETDKDTDRDRMQMRVMKAITSGFFMNAARLSRTGDGYRTVKKGQPVWIHPSSALFAEKPPPRYVVYNELVSTSKEFMRGIMPVSERWLHELAPYYYAKV